MNVFSYFKSRDELKHKINFILKFHRIENHAIFLGLSYIQYCKNISRENLQTYTLCAIILANKYLNDHNYNIGNITSSLDIELKEYIKIEIELLTSLNWNLSKINESILLKYNKLIKCG